METNEPNTARMDAARERLTQSENTRNQRAQTQRLRAITEATEVLDELHRIVVDTIEEDDEVPTATGDLVREVAKRAVNRAGETVDNRNVSTEAYMTPKQRLLLSLASYDAVKEKLSDEAKSLSESVSEPTTPSGENT